MTGSGKNTIPALAGKIRRYVRSPSTRMAAFGGLLTYLSYAYAHGSWANPTLICVSVFVGAFLPSYAKLSNKAELWANNRFGFVTAGRLGRFLPQLAFNLVMFWLMLWGGALNQLGISSVGGFAGAALVTTLASQGTQFLGGYFVARGVGDANRNTLIGLLVNVTLAALGTAGVPYAREAFLILGFALGGLFFGIGLLSDLRSKIAPKGGIGMFFGTFNPFHNTHLTMLERVIRERDLDKVIIHPVLVPKLHVDAFRDGHLRVGRLEGGFQIYEKTDSADSNVDYFPTGNKFLPPETRKALIELAVAEAGLGDKIEVAYYPEIYNSKGFQGVIAEIKTEVSRCALACAARYRLWWHAGAPDRRRVWLDLSVACPAPRQRFRDCHPQGCQGHDVRCGDRRARAAFAEPAGGDGWGPSLPERQRSFDRGGLT